MWVFAGMFIGFAVKVPMFPFHTWLPDAHTQAPTQGSVILAAILLKLGTYGFVRIAIPFLPQAAVKWAPWIGLLAVIGIIYGALGCLAQTDMKRLIAFSSVAHMGFVMLGIATLTPLGFNAAIFGMVAHGLITGMLFFLAGSVKERYHTLEIQRLSGMLKQIPKLAWILGFCAMASLGLPGLAGFWGEFPAILSAYNPLNGTGLPFGGLNVETFRVYMVIAAVGTVLAAAYLLWLYQRTAFGEPNPEFVADSHIAHSVGAAANPHDEHARHPRRRPVRVDRLDPVARRHPRARRVPAAAVQDHRSGRHQHPRGVREVADVQRRLVAARQRLRPSTRRLPRVGAGADPRVRASAWC